MEDSPNKFDRGRFADKFNFIVREAVVPQLSATNRDEAIRELVTSLVKTGAVRPDAQDAILAALLKREGLGSTGIGNGVAVPHAKCEAVDRVIGTMGWSKAGIDFGAIDQKAVYLVILVVFPPDHAGAYLRALEEISRELRDLPRPLGP
ncbi:MAG TPA: PTS sugar transporter subunit IIA [Pirellulales bacterium]|nr:PTS sugar transporter subunit IIA [Pirellulales bacterium]